MANVQTSIDIAAPVQRVWELVTDGERLGDWLSVSGCAERETAASLGRLKQLAEG